LILPTFFSYQNATYCRVYMMSLTFLLFTLPVAGQSISDQLRSDNYDYSSQPAIAPQRRWLLSWNPLGLLEPSMAIGIGIGYHPNINLEIWSETSLLRNVLFPSAGSTSGMRQILQFKRFISKDPRFFVAAEIRYIFFTYHSSDNFRNSSVPETPLSLSNTSDHYVFGAGLQAGYRRPITNDSRLILELTAGLGIKNKIIRWNGVPAGYEYMNRSIDVNVWDLIETPGTSVYLPGSLRLVYTFGKKPK
jgi:hypothetical protein